MSAEARVGVDVGGTFTDVILHGADGRVAFRKLLSTPPSYDRAVVEAVGGLAAGGAVAEVVHGTTVATNAVLERRGSPTALVTTAGFRDVLELRRLRIPHMYDLFWRKPPPLVERYLRFELNERVAADGTVVRALDEEESRALAARLRGTGVESVAVCFLHSYLYPEHERRFGAILAEELPEVNVSLSSEILREQREYERSATTVVNAYVRPLMSSYIDRIRTGLDGIGLDGPLQIMQSSGGVMTSDDAKQRPVFALESGPAAGVVAARGMGQQLGVDNLLAFDMGGTTAKASLIEDGAISRGREYEVGGSMSAGSRLIRGAGELLRIPTIDIAEVGAGGGSIAWIDPAGGLQVGPRSAGADPGPACYGRGGVEPTVTDANVVLGYMPAVTVADGQVSISAELAEQAVLPRRRAARADAARGGERDPPDRERADDAGAAGGLVREGARPARLRADRLRRRRADPRRRAGRGPRHADRARAGGRGPLQRRRPPLRAAGVPRGADLPPGRRCRRSRRGRRLTSPRWRRGSRTCSRGAPRSSGRGRRTSATAARAGRSRSAARPARSTPGVLAALRARFEDEHERLYGVKDQAGSPVEIRALRLAALGEAAATRSFQLDGANGAGPGGASRRIHIGGDDMDAPVRQRSSLGEAPEPGPLLVDEYDTTVVVPPGWSARRDAATGTLILERSGDGD